MDIERERALTLAHEAALSLPGCSAEMVVDRARVYLDFLRGKRDAEIISAARALSEKFSPPT